MMRKIFLGKTDRSWMVFLSLILLFLTIIYAFVYELSKSMGVRLEIFTRDMFAVAEVPVYTGIISNLGVSLWMATACVCAFSCFAGSRAKETGSLRGMLLFAAAFNFILMIDDFFMLHESIFPLELGVPEKYIFLVYILVAFFFLVLYWRQFLNSRIWILVIAFTGFALSILIDSSYLISETLDWRIVVFENYFKLVGVGSWFIYFCLRGREYVRHGSHVARD